MVIFDELSITPDGKNMIIDVRIKDTGLFDNQSIEGIYVTCNKAFHESGFYEDDCIAFKRFDINKAPEISIYKNNKKLSETIIDPQLYLNRELTIPFEALDTISEGSHKIIMIEDDKIAFENDVIPHSYFWIACDTTNLSLPDSFVSFNKEKKEYPKSVTTSINVNEFVLKDKCLKTLSDNLYFVYVKTIGEPSFCTPCGEDSEYTLGVTFDVNILYQKSLDFIKELSENCTMPKNFIDFILQYEMLKSAIETEHLTIAVKFFEKLFKEKNVKNSKCKCNERYNI